MHHSFDLTRRSRLAAVLIGAALLTLSGVGATAHADRPDPQLSIAVDNGATSARSGDQLRYTVTVTNLGTKEVKNLRVSQTVPTGASFVSADAGGDRAKGKVGWSVDLAAAAKITLRTTLKLRTTPESALRLATVACAQVSAKGPALVCASDSDELPAGAAVKLAAANAGTPQGWWDGARPWYLAGGAGLIGLAAFGAVRTTSRRHAVAARARE